MTLNGPRSRWMRSRTSTTRLWIAPGSDDVFTVVEIQAKAGDRVDSGRVVAVIAVLDPLYARTVDLTELDVGRVAVRQPVEVSVDALAGRAFQGTVREISLRGKDHRGDVVYTVTVELDDVNVDPPLRWGMMAMVRIYTK